LKEGIYEKVDFDQTAYFMVCGIVNDVRNMESILSMCGNGSNNKLKLSSASSILVLFLAMFILGFEICSFAFVIAILLSCVSLLLIKASAISRVNSGLNMDVITRIAEILNILFIFFVSNES
jgi:hypothetical protein